MQNSLIKLFFVLHLVCCVMTSARSQYCVGGGPSSSIDSNIESISLIGETTTISYTGCPGLLGLEDNTSNSVDLIAGNSYTLNIQFGTCGNNYAGAGEVWIDFNGDQTFDLSETIGTWSGTPPVVMSTFNFTVPAGACNGTFRLRAMQEENGTNPLDPCGTFSWGSMVDYSVIISGGTCSGGGGGNYCEGGPSQTADSNVESVNLVGNTSTISYNTLCPGVTGVQDLTFLSADLGSGPNYTLDVQFGTCGGNYGGSGEVWIDWDQSNTFDPSESIGTWSGAPPTSLSSFVFNVPVNAVMGTTTMRVIQQENATPPLDPCVNFTWGSVMDFSINVVTGIDCSGYQGDDIPDAIQVPSLPYVDTNANTVCYSNQWPAYSSADVHYMVFVDPLSTEITASLCNSDFDTYLTIIEPNGNVVSYNDDGPCGSGNSEITFPTGNHDTLIVIVEGWGSNTGNYILNLSDDAGTIGVDELTNIAKVYPMPVVNRFTIENSSPIDIIHIYDMNGKLIQQENGLGKRSISIESDLPSGSYLLKIIDERGKLTRQLIQIMKE